MSLSKEKIIANTEKYFETAKKQGFLTPELEELLSKDLITAPASTMVKLHNAFEGGLVDHILRVMNKAYYVNKHCICEKDRVSNKSLIKTVYLHQLGKLNLYVPNESKWHRDNLGKMYEFNDELPSMRVGERSIFYLKNCNIDLEVEEFQAILNHDKVDDTQSEWYNSTLGDILKIAIRLAIMEEKTIQGEV